MRVERGDGWEVTSRPPAPALRALAGTYRGYRERAGGPVDRREVPHPGVVLIVNLGGPLVVDGAAHGSFAAGLACAPTAAGILRFDHAVELLAGPAPRSLAAVALACGYYDQAHLNRDFRRFAGCTPTAYLAARRPELLGVAFVQDGS